MLIRALSVVGLIGLVDAGCSPPAASDKELLQASTPSALHEGAVRFEKLGPDLVQGVFELRGKIVDFRAEVGQVTLKVRGLALVLTADPATQAFDLDGFDAATGEDVAITIADETLLHELETAIADLYAAHSEEWPALKLLNRGLGLWGGWPVTTPLRFFAHVSERFWESLCGNLNKPGQGTGIKWISATHDCGTILTWSIWGGTCSQYTAGCVRWEDPSTTDRVAMSMHPGGFCSDGTYFGNSFTAMSCTEPDHPYDREFSYGNCFGRCGSGCGSDTQFTADCLDHDQCVRFGHDGAAVGCDDDFADTVDDWALAPSCGGNINVQFNWAGTSFQQNCPTTWLNTNDGCDFNCQFLDGDCFR
jgi:hypothetical protein